MAAVRLATLCLGLLSLARSARVLQPPSSAITSEMRPIRKVITLLEEMKAQVEKDAEADQVAYDKYMCWCTTNRKDKTAAIDTAETRIGELDTFLEESTAKEGSLKTEIAGLADDIASDQDALSTAQGIREGDKKAFLAEEADMKETRMLLGQAIDVLGKVQLLQKQGHSAEKESHQATVALVQVRDAIHQRFPKFHDTLQRDLFDFLGSLPAGAAQEQRNFRGLALPQSQLLPWEKSEEQIGKEAKPNSLMGQAANAKSYNSRSGSILGVLEEMQDEFSRDLFAAQKADFESEVDFQNLRAAKSAEIASASKQKERKEASLADTLDKAAKAKEESESLQQAMAADQAFLATLEKNCKSEDEGYKSRVAVRSEEIRALGEALTILTEDSARDLYAKTVSFAQLLSSRRAAVQDRALRRAMQRIADAARKGKNWALASLAVRMQLDAFTKVKAAMNTMLAELAKQQKEEYAKWEDCKKDIDTTEDDITVAAQLKKDLAEKHTAVSDEIKTLNDEMAALKKDIEESEISLKQAGEERKAENGVFQTSISDQRATTNILKKAATRLRAFYGFNQVSSGQEPGAAAPPPPPSGKAYQKSALSGGVLQLFDKIIKTAEIEEQELAAAEQKSQEDYGAYVQGATASIEADREAVRQREKRLAEAEAEKSDTQAQQLANDEDLSKLGDLLQAHHLECDYVLKYFDVRQKARQEEMDAINDAKAILSGAKFDA